MTSKPNRKPIDVSAFAAAAMPQPNPVDVAVAGAATPASAPSATGNTWQPEAAAHVAHEGAISNTVAAVKPLGRAGKVGMQMWVEPEKRRKLKRYSADKDRTVDALLAEALDDLLRKLNLD